MAFKFSDELSDSPHYIAAPIRSTWQGIELTVARENIEKPTIWKIHEDRHALIVHLGGKINMIETEIDRRVSKLAPPTSGEVWLVPAGSEYFSYTQGESAHYAEFYFEPIYLDKFIGEAYRDHMLTPLIGHFDSFLFQNVKQLVSHANNADDLSKLIGENVSQTICLHLFSNYNAARSVAIKDRRRFDAKCFSRIQEYIHDNLSEKITLADLAELARTSEHNLLRSFNSSFGRSPAQYIIEQRLRKARWLLANTKKDIATIAYETGFSSHSHLTSSFKKNVGSTPHDFRRLH